MPIDDAPVSGRSRRRCGTERVSVRALLGGLLAMAVLARVSPAGGALAMAWDCYLPDSLVDCGALRNSLTSKIPFLVVVSDRQRADVTITVTSLPAEDGMRFVIDLRGREVDGYATAVHTWDKVPSIIDSSTTMLRLITKLERGLDDFMDQKVAAEAIDGKLSIVVTDPVDPPFVGRREQSALRWYVEPALSSSFSDVKGVGVNAWGTASFFFNSSQPQWRTQQRIETSYLRQSQPVPGSDAKAVVEFAGASATNVLALAITSDNRWTVGTLLSAEKNPQANYAMRANASAGMELDLVPRLTVNQANLGFRCALGPELQRYDVRNVEGLDRQAIVRQFCDVYLTWHFVPFDVSASLAQGLIMKDLRYWNVGAMVSATFRITESLVVSPSLSVQETNRAINEAAPTDVSTVDPKSAIEASMLAAIRRGYTSPLNIQSTLTISYLFGNGSFASEDQRWKRVSNLR
jgi:hypothetical protein